MKKKVFSEYSDLCTDSSNGDLQLILRNFRFG